MIEWRRVVQSAWQHSDVNFEPKSQPLLVGFLGKVTYGFEASEVKNPMLQMDCNLELKRGRYGQSKQCCARSILLWDCIRVQFFLVVQAEFWVSPFGLILVAIGPFGFSFFANPIFGCKIVFDNLEFIQI